MKPKVLSDVLTTDVLLCELESQ